MDLGDTVADGQTETKTLAFAVQAREATGIQSLKLIWRHARTVVADDKHRLA